MHSNSKAALAFTRPSRHNGPEHIVRVDAASLRPFACTCEAGRRGLLCHAVIATTATDLLPIARQRWERACGQDEIEAAAHVLVQVRKWAAAARELQALRSCGYVPVKPQPEVSIA
jgi:hypothetical protein